MPTKDPRRTAACFRHVFINPTRAANLILECQQISPELRKHYEEVVRILRQTAQVDGKPPASH